MNKIWKFIGEGSVSYLKAAYLLTDELIKLFDRSLFCKLFNLRSALLGWPVRFAYEADLGIYQARSNDLAQYFLNKSQALYAYRKSLAFRAHSLGIVYQLDKIDFQDGDLVVDCGANVGDLLLYFKTHGLQIRYLGFEPSPGEYRCLELNAKEHRVYNAGLWNQASELEFFISSNNADSSFIEPVGYDEVRIVPTVRLDDVVNEKIKLLKLEAEGAEPEVLAGAERLLGNVHYISADIDYERGVEQASTLAPVVNYLAARGFQLVNVTDSRVVRRMTALFVNPRFPPA